MATIASLNIALTADSAQLNRALTEAEARSQRYARRSRRAYDSINQSIRRLNAAFGIFAGFFAGASLARTTDAFIGINNLLRSSGVAAEDLGAAFGVIQRLAIETRSDLESTGRLFATIVRNSQDLGVEVEQIVIVTRTIQQAFALAGASAAEAAGATRQLSQALASGVLRGEELNSVMENAPEIARLIAAELGVGIGQMRELAAEGRITSDIVFRALENGAEGINRRFQETSATFGQLATIFNARIAPIIAQVGVNLLPRFEAALEAVTAVAQQLSIVFRDVGNNIGIVLTGISFVLLRRVLPAMRAWAARTADSIRLQATLAAQTARDNILLAGYGRQLNTTAMASTVFGRSILTAGGSLTFSARAAGVATVALGGLRAAMAALFTPLNIIIAIGLTIASIFGDQIVAGFRVAVNFIVRQLNRLLSGLDEFIQYFGGDGIQFRFQEWAAASEEVADNLGELNLELTELPESLDTAATMATSFQRTLESAADTASRLSEAGSNAFNGISDALTDLVTTGMASFADLARAIIRDLIRIAIQAAITRAITGSVFGPGGGVGDFFGSIFGSISGRQFGGPVNAGRPYVVGEAGPELFVPTAAGSVIPNDQFTQASSVGDVTIVNQIGPNVSARQVGDSVGSIFMDLINNTSLDQGAGVVSRVREAV